MVEESFQYHAEPADEEVARRAWSDIQTCREVYNHALTQHYRPALDHDKPSYTAMQNKLPGWKQRWPEWERYTRSACKWPSAASNTPKPSSANSKPKATTSGS